MKIQVLITRQENADFFKCNINDIVLVEFEQYVAAVVASEIGNSNLEACKAQAVAARTYAIYKGALDNKPISDSSSTAQAYRAIRYNRTLYPNALKATELTEGQVLYYNNTPALTVYSSSNGGQTVSAEDRWGSPIPYLIQKTDPWDNNVKNGHGVGLSQKGAIWAGNHNFSYIEILKFYYPGTILQLYHMKKLMNNIQKIAAKIEEKI